MINLPDTSKSKAEKHDQRLKNQNDILPDLRLQSRWAAFLVFSPCVFAALSCWSIIRDEPFASLYLLPALLVAVHIARYLYRHLTANHLSSQSDHLFPTLGVANWVTLLRAAAVVLLAGLLPFTIRSDSGLSDPTTLAWVSAIMYLLISFSDLLDGYMARNRGRETELGKKLDIETDAAGILVASLLAVALSRLPVGYLFVGLAYYPFAFGIWLRKRRKQPLVSLKSRPYARIIAGFQMGLVALALMPVFKTPFTHLAAYIFMVPFLIGFVRDWLIVSCRITTNADQQSSQDLWIRSRVVSTLPLVFRLVIILATPAIIAQSASFRAHLSWHLVLCLFSILSAIGCIGRIASLLLILMLGSRYSPYGETILPLTLFASAAALLLSGTGIMSIYSPEDAILYRHSQEDKRAKCELT